ncbi:MAG: hypothetical protein WBA12_06990, partial [Catalinimonas sp.]
QWGFNRFDQQEWLELNTLRGVARGQVRGNKRVVLSAESVLFTPFNLLGFRTAPFVFADFSVVVPNNRRLFTGPLYQGWGLGLRIRNEHLAFNTFQLRLAWYPNLPDNPAPLRTAFGALPRFQLDDFDVREPGILPYR